VDEVTDDRTGDFVPRPDPTRLTTQQLNREILGLKEIIYTRLEGMDRAIVLCSKSSEEGDHRSDNERGHLQELLESRMDRMVILFNKSIEESDKLSRAEIVHLRGLLESRLDAMDKAVVLLQNIADRTPGAIAEQTSALQEIQDEKFSSIQVQFKERDVRTDQTLIEGKLAVNAALQALKEAVDEKFSSIQVQFKERDVRTDQTSKDSKTAVDAALQAAKEAVGEQNKSSAMAISKSEASVVKQIDQMGLLITTQAKAVDDKFSDIKDRLTRIEGKGEGKVVADTTHQASSSQIFTIISIIIAFVSVCAGILIAVHKG
jgi:hypothetical protein